MEIVLMVLKGFLLVTAVIMTFFILLQEGKGGGLAGLGGTKAAGVEGVTNPIRRATAYLAVIFFLLAVAIGYLSRGQGSLTGEGGIAEEGEAFSPSSEVDKKDTETPPAEMKEPPPVDAGGLPDAGAKKEGDAPAADVKKEDEAKEGEAPVDKDGDAQPETEGQKEPVKEGEMAAPEKPEADKPADKKSEDKKPEPAPVENK